jgi:hypothetical protein
MQQVLRLATFGWPLILVGIGGVLLFREWRR